MKIIFIINSIIYHIFKITYLFNLQLMAMILAEIVIKLAKNPVSSNWVTVIYVSFTITAIMLYNQTVNYLTEKPKKQ